MPVERDAHISGPVSTKRVVEILDESKDGTIEVERRSNICHLDDWDHSLDCHHIELRLATLGMNGERRRHSRPGVARPLHPLVRSATSSRPSRSPCFEPEVQPVSFSGRPFPLDVKTSLPCRAMGWVQAARSWPTRIKLLFGSSSANSRMPHGLSSIALTLGVPLAGRPSSRYSAYRASASLTRQ